MRELSVVGPAPTPSSVYTHCHSRSCDQRSGHKKPEHCLTHHVMTGAAWGGYKYF